MSELTTAGDIFVPVQHGICLPRRRRVFAGLARRFMFFEFGSNGEERDRSEESRGMCIGGGLAFEVITCNLVYRIADFK